MSKIVKIKENYEFRRAYKKGTAKVSPYFAVYYLKNRKSFSRLGITASKKLGGAVQRNRAKRVITAAFRNCINEIDGGYDFVIVARTRILSVKSTVVEEALRSLLEKDGII